MTTENKGGISTGGAIGIVAAIMFMVFVVYFTIINPTYFKKLISGSAVAPNGSPAANQPASGNSTSGLGSLLNTILGLVGGKTGGTGNGGQNGGGAKPSVGGGASSGSGNQGGSNNGNNSNNAGPTTGEETNPTPEQGGDGEIQYSDGSYVLDGTYYNAASEEIGFVSDGNLYDTDGNLIGSASAGSDGLPDGLDNYEEEQQAQEDAQQQILDEEEGDY